MWKVSCEMIVGLGNLSGEIYGSRCVHLSMSRCPDSVNAAYLGRLKDFRILLASNAC